MPKIFCCYRRDDSTHQAGRISDHLTAHFGPDQLFKDVDCIPPGQDYRQVLLATVAQCDILVALIGDAWLSTPDGAGGRRIDNPSDWVRVEIETALRRGIPVMPVLVGQAPMPRAEDLPEGLRDLAFRQELRVRPDPDFHRDVVRLIRGINDALGTRAGAAATPATPPPRAKAPAVPPPAAELPRSGRVAALGAHARSYLVEKVLKTTPKSGAFPAAGPPGAPAGTAPERTVRVGILKSGNATYVNEIERALLASLDTRLAGQRVRLAPSNDCVEWGEEVHWATTVARLLTRGGRDGFRFLVGIGTQAAVALHGTLGPDFGKVPTLLLGVTYPRIAGLVDSEHFRCESRQVTGIRYGCGLDAVASLLHHRIFPGRKLCFVFQAGIPQDEMAHAELATTRLVREGHLRVLRLERRLQADDLADEDTVYFSWYTFTRLFHDKEFSILLRRLTVSIMQDNVRDGAAAVGVGTDHDWIGDRGAELVVEHLTAPDGAKPNWGTRDVVISPLVYWLHRGLARRHGIEFSREVLDGAREVYE
jgi:hypothetical protein